MLLHNPHFFLIFVQPPELFCPAVIATVALLDHQQSPNETWRLKSPSFVPLFTSFVLLEFYAKNQRSLFVLSPLFELLLPTHRARETPTGLGWKPIKKLIFAPPFLVIVVTKCINFFNFFLIPVAIETSIELHLMLLLLQVHSEYSPPSKLEPWNIFSVLVAVEGTRILNSLSSFFFSILGKALLPFFLCCNRATPPFFADFG